MTLDVIQAQYDNLESIAIRFGQWAEINTQMSYRVRQSVEGLVNGGWEGEGAEAFFNEMGSEVLPAIDRLTVVLEQSQQTLRQIITILQQAEREAAALFGGGQFYTPTDANRTDPQGREVHAYSVMNRAGVRNAIAARIADLNKHGLTPDNTSVYNSEDAIGTVFLNPRNRAVIEKMASRYGISPALLAGIVAAEMDFDHEPSDYIQDGIGRRGIPLPGVTVGIASVHEETREYAAKYLKENSLSGANWTTRYDNSTQNRASFNGSVEAAAMVAAMYTRTWRSDVCRGYGSDLGCVSEWD